MTHIGLILMEDGDIETGISATKAFWKDKGMDTGGLFLHDGSGLFRGNMLTTSQLVFILKYMKTQSKYYQSFY